MSIKIPCIDCITLGICRSKMESIKEYNLRNFHPLNGIKLSYENSGWFLIQFIERHRCELMIKAISDMEGDENQYKVYRNLAEHLTLCLIDK